MLSQEALLTPLKLRESHYTRLLSEHAAQVRHAAPILPSACSVVLTMCTGTHCRGGSQGIPPAVRNCSGADTSVGIGMSRFVSS